MTVMTKSSAAPCPDPGTCSSSAPRPGTPTRPAALAAVGTDRDWDPRTLVILASVATVFQEFGGIVYR